jgi:hypothetical protein
MAQASLQQQLITAYSAENLNKISTKIIHAYRQREFNYLEQLVAKIAGGAKESEGKAGRLFSRLIMLYHPDKLNQYQKALKACADDKCLKQYAHILITLDQLDKITGRPAVNDLNDFHFEADFGIDDDDLDYVDDFDSDDFEYSGGYDDINDEVEFRDFITVLKKREMGGANARITAMQLEGLEGALEMTEEGIDDLTGINHCKNLRILDLSINEIEEIDKIGEMASLEELYLSANTIFTIDPLQKLTMLKRLDISFNEVDDLSPLFSLKSLEYVNVMGTNVAEEQIEALRKNGVMVIS